MRILVMPFLNIPSGHHQVADAVSEWIRMVENSVEFDKVDIVEYKFGRLTSLVSATYINFIRSCPNLYSWFYKNAFLSGRKRTFHFYERLFLQSFKELLREKRPDLLICTHALPSRLASVLKSAGELHLPVVNVYTDLFVHDVWGIDGIDYHLAPNQNIKEWLIGQGVREDRVFVTGIPTHPKISRGHESLKNPGNDVSILVATGNLGLGAVRSFVKSCKFTGKVHYHVLCGKNTRLYRYLQRRKNPYVTPLPYIESREEMNRLYDQIDGIMTKAGGVTVSEGLKKRLPIFIFDTLPGQEEMNMEFLNRMGLIYDLKSRIKHGLGEAEILSLFLNEKRRKELSARVEEYNQQLVDSDLPKVFHHFILPGQNQCSKQDLPVFLAKPRMANVQRVSAKNP